MRELDRVAGTLPAGVVRRVGSIRLAGLPGDPADAAEAADRERELADCAAHAAALRAHGIAVEDYDGPLGRGITLPDDAAVNPAVRAIHTAARLRERARLYEHTPVTAVAAGEVRTARGTVRAGAVVVAVDGRLERLVPELAGRVRTARLQMLATDPVAPGRVPCPVYGRLGLDYAQQGGDGRLFVGGGHVGGEPGWTDEMSPSAPVQAYVETVAARMAGGPVRATHRWAAPVGFTPDGRPLCVRVADGVVGAGGYSGTGNLVGAVTARAALASALDGAPPPAWASG